MRFVLPRSQVTTDDAGLTWLQPVEGSTRVRHTIGTFLLSLTIVLGGATWFLLPAPLSVLGTIIVVALALWLLAGIVWGAGSRVAMSELGLYVQDGGRAAQLGWTAIEAVTAVPSGPRWKIRIDDGYRPRTTRAPFEAAVAREWLALVSAEAARRQLRPVALPDGTGFTVAGS